MDLDKEAISTWLIISVIATILFIVIIYSFGVEAHDLLGVAETIDVQFTGQTESIKAGQVIHTKSV